MPDAVALDPIGDATPHQRASGRIALVLRRQGPVTRVARLAQEGSARLRLPRIALERPFEAILVNTAGGLTGGDRLQIEVEAGAGSDAVVSTAAGEKVYRSTGPAATVETVLAAGPGASLDWLPQETILFDRAHLVRRVDIRLAGDARLLAVEAVLFGRLAHGERAIDATLRDRWRVRRDGRLVYADGLALGPGLAGALDRPAVLAGGRAMATVLLLAPDAEARVEPLRAALDAVAGTGVIADRFAEAGATARDGCLVLRLAAADGMALRAALGPALAVLRAGRPLPALWSC